MSRPEIHRAAEDAPADRREESVVEAAELTAGILGQVARPGFFGTVPLEFAVRDGLVEVVKSTGVEQTFKLQARKVG